MERETEKGGEREERERKSAELTDSPKNRRKSLPQGFNVQNIQRIAEK